MKKLTVYDTDTRRLQALDPRNATGVPIPAFRSGLALPAAGTIQGEAFVNSNTGEASIWDGAAWKAIAKPVVSYYPTESALLSDNPKDGTVAVAESNGNMFSRVGGQWRAMGARLFGSVANRDASQDYPGTVGFVESTGEWSIRIPSGFLIPNAAAVGTPAANDADLQTAVNTIIAAGTVGQWLQLDPAYDYAGAGGVGGIPELPTAMSGANGDWAIWDGTAFIQVDGATTSVGNSVSTGNPIWAPLNQQTITVGNTAPTTPLIGHQWYETAAETLWVYDGTNWIPISVKQQVYDTYATMTAAVKPAGAIVFCKELPFAGTYVADAAAANGFRRLSNRTSFTYTTPSAFADAADRRRVLVKDLSPNSTSYRITVRDTADDGAIYEFILSVSLYRNPDIHPHLVNSHNSKIEWLGQTYNGTDGLKIVAQFDADATDKTYEIFVEADGADLNKATSPAALVETDEPSMSHKVNGKKDFPDDVQRRLTAGRAGNPAEVLAWTGGSLGNSQDGHNILLEYGKLHKFSGFLINRGGTSMPLLSITKNVDANDKVDVSNALNSHCMNLDIDSNTLSKFTLVHSLGFTNIWQNSWGVTQNKAICMDITVDMRDPNYWTFKFEAMGHASDGHYIKSEGQIVFRNDATGYGFYFTHTGSQTVDWRMFRDH